MLSDSAYYNFRGDLSSQGFVIFLATKIVKIMMLC